MEYCRIYISTTGNVGSTMTIIVILVDFCSHCGTSTCTGLSWTMLPENYICSCYTASDNWKLPVQVTGNHLDFTNKRGRQWITINSTKVLWNMLNPMWLMVGDRPHAVVGLF